MTERIYNPLEAELRALADAFGAPDLVGITATRALFIEAADTLRSLTETVAGYEADCLLTQHDDSVLSDLRRQVSALTEARDRVRDETEASWARTVVALKARVAHYEELEKAAWLLIRETYEARDQDDVGRFEQVRSANLEVLRTTLATLKERP